MSMENVSESAFGRLINISARQRMLSQRIGFLFLTIRSAVATGHAPPMHLLDLMRTATADFQDGYRILNAGKPEEDLPHLQSPRVQAILDGETGPSGRDVIQRFIDEALSGADALSGGHISSDVEVARFSEFILCDVLAVLQSIVAAIEADFNDEMNRRRQRRQHDVTRVMQALQDIQKASKFSRMIALNAKISADRAGPHGLEFGALTDEIKAIANDITESSEDIIRHLEHV